MTYPAPAPLPPLKGRLALWLGAMIMIGGVVVGGAMVASGIFGVRDAVNSYQRVPASGGSIHVAKPGRYTVYLEAPGINELAPATVPDGLLLVSGPTGPLPISYSNSTTTYHFGGHSGVSIGSFRAPVAGTYLVGIARQGGLQGATLAVGRTDLSGFARLGIGVLVGGVLFLLGLILLIVGAVRRGGSRRDRARAQGIVPGVWGGPAAAGVGAGYGAPGMPGERPGWVAPPSTPVGWAAPAPPLGSLPGTGSWPASPPTAGPFASAAPPPPPGPAGWPVPPAPQPMSPVPAPPPAPPIPPVGGPADGSASPTVWASPPGPRPAWPPVPPSDGGAGGSQLPPPDPTVPDPWHRAPDQSGADAVEPEDGRGQP